jgi:flagellar assembly factor FliW
VTATAGLPGVTVLGPQAAPAAPAGTAPPGGPVAKVAAMRVATARFGEIEVDDERVILCPEGLPGFPDARRFVLVDVRETGVFYWLQSLDDPALAFLAVVPWPFFPDYEPELPDADRDALGLSSADDALVLCLLTVHRDDEVITANLMAPVVVNRHTRRARQVVLADAGWPLQAPLPAPPVPNSRQ